MRVSLRCVLFSFRTLIAAAPVTASQPEAAGKKGENVDVAERATSTSVASIPIPFALSLWKRSCSSKFPRRGKRVGAFRQAQRERKQKKVKSAFAAKSSSLPGEVRRDANDNARVRYSSLRASSIDLLACFLLLLWRGLCLLLLDFRLRFVR